MPFPGWVGHRRTISAPPRSCSPRRAGHPGVRGTTPRGYLLLASDNRHQQQIPPHCFGARFSRAGGPTAVAYSSVPGTRRTDHVCHPICVPWWLAGRTIADRQAPGVTGNLVRIVNCCLENHGPEPPGVSQWLLAEEVLALLVPRLGTCSRHGPGKHVLTGLESCTDRLHDQQQLSTDRTESSPLSPSRTRPLRVAHILRPQESVRRTNPDRPIWTPPLTMETW